MKPRPVLVYWDDAWHQSAQEDLPLTDDAPATAFSVGHLVKKSKRHLTLTMMCVPENGHVRYTLRIPRGMVRKIVSLKGKKR